MLHQNEMQSGHQVYLKNAICTCICMCVYVQKNLILSSHLGTALLVKLIFMEISKTSMMTSECATILAEHVIRMFFLIMIHTLFCAINEMLLFISSYVYTKSCFILCTRIVKHVLFTHRNCRLTKANPSS